MNFTKSDFKNYFILLPFFILLFGFAWSKIALGKLYVCKDPILILDLFLIPLVHKGNTGDYFIYSPFITYAIWLITMLITFLLPLILVKFNKH